MQGKKAITRSWHGSIESKTLVLSCLVLSCLVLSCQAIVCPVDFCKQVDDVVGLIKVVLNIVVLGWYSQLDKFVFKGTGLFKKTMHLSDCCCFHTDIVILETQNVRGLFFRLCSWRIFFYIMMEQLCLCFAAVTFHRVLDYFRHLVWRERFYLLLKFSVCQLLQN